MKNEQDMVKDFHIKYRLTVNDKPTIIDDDSRVFRQDLIDEEINELFEAMILEDLSEIAKELIDSIYVLIGTALYYGIDLELIFKEVHRSNMTKSLSCVNGKPEKGSNWSKTKIASIMFRK